jgi:hypothetical protein
MQCGTAFGARQSEINKGAGKYCSRACKHESQRGPGDHRVERVEFACTHCGSVSMRRTSDLIREGRKFCSMECAVASRGGRLGARISRECLRCGAKFAVTPSDTKKFCGKGCRYASARGTRSVPIEESFWARVDKSGPVVAPDLGACWGWVGALDRKGYGRLSSRIQGQYLAHRLSWAIAFGDPPGCMLVCHRCDNPRCVRPDHLFLGTAQDNTDDMMLKGRHSVRVKLTEEQVREIRARYGAGESQASLSIAFSVGRPAIHGIVHRKARKNVA